MKDTKNNSRLEWLKGIGKGRTAWAAGHLLVLQRQGCKDREQHLLTTEPISSDTSGVCLGIPYGVSVAWTGLALLPQGRRLRSANPANAKV
eukprot:1020628-Pelagomonas_calceolata.AAC.8